MCRDRLCLRLNTACRAVLRPPPPLPPAAPQHLEGELWVSPKRRIPLGWRTFVGSTPFVWH